MSIERKTPLEIRSQIELYAEQLEPENLDRGRILFFLQELSHLLTSNDGSASKNIQELIERNKEDFVRFLRKNRIHRKHDGVEQIKERVAEYETYRESVNMLRKQLQDCFAESEPAQAVRQLDTFVGAGMHGVYLSIPDKPDVIVKFIDSWIELEWGAYKADGVHSDDFLQDVVGFHLQLIAYAKMKEKKHFAQMITFSPEDRVLIVKRLQTASHVDTKNAFTEYTTEQQVLDFAKSVHQAGRLGVKIDFGKDDIMVDSQGNFFAVDYELFRFFEQDQSREDTVYDYIRKIEEFFQLVLGSHRGTIYHRIADELDDLFSFYKEKYKL